MIQTLAFFAVIGLAAIVVGCAIIYITATKDKEMN